MGGGGQAVRTGKRGLKDLLRRPPMTPNGGVVIGAVAIVAVVLVITVALLVGICRRSASRVARIAAAASAVVLVVLWPFAVDQIVASLNRTRGVTYVMIDPGWASKLIPAVAAIVAAVIVRTRTQEVTR